MTELLAVIYAFPAVALAFVLVPWLRGRVPSAPVRWIVVSLPYFCCALILLLGSRESMIHFRLEGIQFELREGAEWREIRIGGDGERDDYYVQNLPSDAFRLVRDGEDLVLRHGAGFDGRQVVKVAGRFHALYPLKDGDTIDIESGTDSTLTIAFEQGGVAGSSVQLSADGSEFRVPRRRVSPPMLPAIEIFGFSQHRARVFPLTQVPAVGDRFPERLSAWILFDRRSKHELSVNGAFLLAPDPRVSCTSQMPSDTRITIPSGASLSFHQVVGKDRQYMRTEHLISRVDLQDSVVILEHTHPQTRALSFGSSEDSMVVVASRPCLPSFEGTQIVFSNLTKRFFDAFALVLLGGRHFEVLSPWETDAERPPSYGESVQIGSQNALLLRITHHGIPYRLIGYLAVAAVLTLLALGPLGHLRYTALLGGTAFLTTSRLLFAHAASVRPPFHAEVVPLAVALLVLVPVFLLTVHVLMGLLFGGSGSDSDSRYRIAGQALGGIIIAAVVIWFAAGSLTPFVRVGLRIIPLGAAALVIAAAVSGRVRSAGNWIRRRLKTVNYSQLLVISLVFYLLRFVLLLATGAKESLPGPTRIPLSAIYTPGFVILLSLGTTRFIEQLRHPRERLEAAIPFAVFSSALCLLHFLSGCIVSDLGTTIYLIPAAILLFALGWRVHRTLPGKIRWKGLPLGLPLVLIVIGLLWPLQSIRVFEGLAETSLGSDRLFDTDAVIRDQNLLRLLQFIDPDQLPERGMRNTESIAQNLAIVGSYTRQGWFGEGFMEVQVHPTLYETCLNDYVASVYLLGQFGVLGGVAMVLAFGSLLVVAFRSDWEFVRDRHYPLGVHFPLGAVAALVLTVSSWYMIGANCNLFPFTGKNMYFLGLNSLGDIVESLVLLAFLATAAWKHQRD